MLNRRIFLKAVGVSPLAGLLGIGKAEATKAASAGARTIPAHILTAKEAWCRELFNKRMKENRLDCMHIQEKTFIPEIKYNNRITYPVCIVEDDESLRQAVNMAAATAELHIPEMYRHRIRLMFATGSMGTVTIDPQCSIGWEYRPQIFTNWRTYGEKAKCECRGTGRIWSTITKDDPDGMLTPQSQLAVKSCTCLAGIARSNRLNGN